MLRDASTSEFAPALGYIRTHRTTRLAINKEKVELLVFRAPVIQGAIGPTPPIIANRVAKISQLVFRGSIRLGRSIVHNSEGRRVGFLE